MAVGLPAGEADGVGEGVPVDGADGSGVRAAVGFAPPPQAAVTTVSAARTTRAAPRRIVPLDRPGRAQALVTVKDLMVTLVFGCPSPAPFASSVPPLAIF